MIHRALFAAALLAALPAAHADPIVQWDFQIPFTDLANSSASPSVAASFGTGTASGLHVSADTDWSTPSGNGSSDSFSSNTWATGDYYQFSFATTGFNALSISFDQTRSGTGPDAFKVAYSVDGGANFVDQTTYTVGVVTWNGTTPNAASTFTFNLSGVSALNDQPAAIVRLISTVTPSAGGTNRVDNFIVSGTVSAVPEPGTWAMLLAGVAGVGFIARRRKA